MSDQSQPQASKVRATSSQIRLDSVRHRLDLVKTFCSLAETDLRWGSVPEVESILEKIHHFVGELHMHINEPHYLPPDRIAELGNELDQVVHSVSRIERRLDLKKTKELSGHGKQA